MAYTLPAPSSPHHWYKDDVDVLCAFFVDVYLRLTSEPVLLLIALITLLTAMAQR